MYIGIPACRVRRDESSPPILACGEVLQRLRHGGLRVHGDTVVITYYNAPNAAMLLEHFEGLPERLEAEGIPPGIPWLYNLKLDFRFK